MCNCVECLCPCFLCFSILFVFFFSSRRRHTSWPRDWSSDVCSSDLRICDGFTHFILLCLVKSYRYCCCTRHCSRSEERRVGKECRSRWAPALYRRQGVILRVRVYVESGGTDAVRPLRLAVVGGVSTS